MQLVRLSVDTYVATQVAIEGTVAAVEVTARRMSQQAR